MLLEACFQYQDEQYIKYVMQGSRANPFNLTVIL